MHAGLCLLRLPPRDFWSLTPVEILAMTGGLRPRPAAMDRERLMRLMQAFPDRAGTEKAQKAGKGPIDAER